MSHARRLAALPLLLLLLTPAAARADATAFIGVTPTDQTRQARGLALGAGFLIVGFEFEYGRIVDDLEAIVPVPSLTTGMGNVLVQTPTTGVQVYGTLGGGVYQERLDEDSETSFGTNLGGGLKIRLVGPLRVRLDYRLFRLHGEPRQHSYHRLYAGVNLKF
jgi:opacity protein-like surface antigen